MEYGFANSRTTQAANNIGKRWDADARRFGRKMNQLADRAEKLIPNRLLKVAGRLDQESKMKHED